MEIARSVGFDSVANMRRQDMTFAILNQHAKKGEDIRHVGKQLEWHKLSGGEMRIGDNGTVEVRGINTPGGEWWDSEDLAEWTPDGNLGN